MHDPNNPPNLPASSQPEDSAEASENAELQAKTASQIETFQNRLVKRARHFRRWPTRRDIHCFRLYEKDIPEIPLVVDRYDDHLHITEYERPHTRTPFQHAHWLEQLRLAAAECLSVAPEHAFLKQRSRQEGTTQHEVIDGQRYEQIVGEAGLKFIVNLSDYVDTGLFLDHRVTRGMVRDESKGKHVLNLFAYTGAFSVYAADGAAASTTTVDWSRTYLDWAKRNMALNGFEQPHHTFHRIGVPEFLADRKQMKQNPAVVDGYDIAVVDPPTFSNSKRIEGHWDVQRDHVQLLQQLITWMRPGGTIYFSNNFRGFKWDPTPFQLASEHEISQQTVPEDYRNRRIHRCWKLKCHGGK